MTTANWSLPDKRSAYPLVMGIVNVTPDSFSDGGRWNSPQRAVTRVMTMIEQGVDIVDIGGESTRPGAREITAAEELERVIPVIEALRAQTDIPVSIDTTKAEVMRAAVTAGASMINDVTALTGRNALGVASQCQVPVCLMHMQGKPRTMQDEPHYADVVAQVRDYLTARVEACVAAGIPADQIVVDPGFGFGKTLYHNLRLFQSLQEVAGGQPVLVGVSRKSMIGAVLDRPLEQRLSGSLALAALATWLDAAIVRVHDVEESVDVVRMIRAVRDVEYTAAADNSSAQ